MTVEHQKKTYWKSVVPTWRQFPRHYAL